MDSNNDSVLDKHSRSFRALRIIIWKIVFWLITQFKITLQTVYLIKKTSFIVQSTKYNYYNVETQIENSKIYQIYKIIKVN